jgi:hypothetical protein
MPSEATEFQRLMAQLDYSLFIVTLAAGQERSGCLVGFARRSRSTRLGSWSAFR